MNILHKTKYLELRENNGWVYAHRGNAGSIVIIIPVLKSCGITIEANVKFKVGDEVQILNGNFTGQVGTVESIDAETQIVTVLVDFFGRQTPTELSFEEVKPINE